MDSVGPYEIWCVLECYRAMATSLDLEEFTADVCDAYLYGWEREWAEESMVITADILAAALYGV